jgi:hypothetical protein
VPSARPTRLAEHRHEPLLRGEVEPAAQAIVDGLVRFLADEREVEAAGPKPPRRLQARFHAASE